MTLSLVFLVVENPEFGEFRAVGRRDLIHQQLIAKTFDGPSSDVCIRALFPPTADCPFTLYDIGRGMSATTLWYPI